MDLKYILAIAIIVVAGVALCLGRIDAKDFISIVGIVISYLSGYYAGYRLGRKKNE